MRLSYYLELAILLKVNYNQRLLPRQIDIASNNGFKASTIPMWSGVDNIRRGPTITIIVTIATIATIANIATIVSDSVSFSYIIMPM